MNKNRKPTEVESTLIKRFFTQDMLNSRIKIDELEAMIFANQICEDEDSDFIVYDITDNIKFLIIVTIENGDDGFFKTVSEFVIDLEKEELYPSQEIDIIC